MKKATSLFDFFQKANIDKRYRKVAIYACRNSGGSACKEANWKESKKWIEEWVRDVVKTNMQFSCEAMVNYLNDSISFMTFKTKIN